jgi:hypothetical protein
VRVELKIDFLAWLDAEQGERSTALVDESEDRGILRVVKAVQLAIVDAEAILPKMECATDTGKRRSGVCRCSDGIGIVNDT